MVLFVTFAALVAGCGGENEPTAAETTVDTLETVQADPTTTVAPITSTTLVDEIQLPGWDQIEISAATINPVPASSPKQLSVGESLAMVRVSAVFVDEQATNGSPAELVRALSVKGSKGKAYRALNLTSGWGSKAITEFDALDAQPPVVASTNVEGNAYFVVDSNDTALVPYFLTQRVPVEPADPPASPEQDFVELVQREIPLHASDNQPGRLVEQALEVCEHGRNGFTSDPIPRFELPGFYYSPEAALAHTHSLSEPPDSRYRTFTLLAIRSWCPDLQPLADSITAGNVPPHPNPNVAQ